MALDEVQRKRVEKAAQALLARRRPPVELRAEVDVGWRLKGHSVEIFTVRPAFRGGPGEMLEIPVAKATWIATQTLWKIYWMRGDLRWHGYIEKPSVRHVEAFFDLVDQDPLGCFWG